jgi:hypothetical protein
LTPSHLAFPNFEAVSFFGYLTARESRAADRDGIADMRDVKHNREYGSFREFLSAVAVALKG